MPRISALYGILIVIAMSIRLATRGLMLATAFALPGCAAFSPDAGMGVVAEVAQQGIGKDVVFVRNGEDAERAQAMVRSLLAKTLSGDAAVQVALLNNKGLQAAYNLLALAETELVEQSLPPNPTFAISRIAGTRARSASANTCSRAFACAREIPGFKRAATLRNEPTVSGSSGSQRSLPPRSRVSNSGAVTPTTVCTTPFSDSVLPMTPGSPPSRCVQKP